MCNSLNRIRSQEIATAMEANARYSASVEEHEIVGYFLEDQETKLGSRNTRPEVERQSEGSPAQFAFEKAIRERGPGVKEIP